MVSCRKQKEDSRNYIRRKFRLKILTIDQHFHNEIPIEKAAALQLCCGPLFIESENSCNPGDQRR